MKTYIPNAKSITVEAEVRYWEDAKVNGVQETEEGLNIPCRDGNMWRPIIDIDTGIVVNWPKGITAKTHYKVCDAGRYTIFDDNDNPIFEKDGYVPSLLDVTGESCGDYLIFEIDGNGQILGWINKKSNKMFDPEQWRSLTIPCDRFKQLFPKMCK